MLSISPSNNLKLELKFLYLIVILFSLINSQNDQYVGMRAGVKLTTIKDLQNHFFLDLIKEIQKIKIDNKDFSVDIGITTANIKIEDINLDLNLLRSQNIDISFVYPSSINFKGSNIGIGGNFKIKIKCGFLPEYETKIMIISKKLFVNADLRLDWRNHPNYKNKKTLFFEISNFELDIDFNFSFSDLVTELIKIYFNDDIKSYVVDYMKSSIKDQLIPIINEEINNQFNNLPIYVPVFYDTVMDYSLLEPPKLQNDLLILNLKASFLQKSQIDNYEADEDPYIGLVKLPPMTSTEKGIRVQISPNTVNTQIRSLYKANLLKYSFDIPNIADIVPEKKGIKYILSPQNVLRYHLNKKFGNQTRGRLDFEIIEIPEISFYQKIFSSDVKLRLNLYYENKLSSMESFVIFEVNVHLEASGLVKENVQVDIIIQKFKINSFKTITNNFGHNLTNQVIQFLINFELTKIFETLNKKYLRNVKINLPSVAGMNFNNSKIIIFDNFIEIEVNVIFD